MLLAAWDQSSTQSRLALPIHTQHCRLSALLSFLNPLSLLFRLVQARQNCSRRTATRLVPVRCPLHLVNPDPLSPRAP
jgi:hypothetical protein